MSDELSQKISEKIKEFSGQCEWKYHDHGSLVAKLAERIEQLEVENAKLREALKKYAEHGVRCSYRDYEAAMEGKEYPCDCGLDELLKGGEA